VPRAVPIADISASFLQTLLAELRRLRRVGLQAPATIGAIQRALE